LQDWQLEAAAAAAATHEGSRAAWAGLGSPWQKEVNGREDLWERKFGAIDLLTELRVDWLWVKEKF
jgi:hypothetical protein